MPTMNGVRTARTLLLIAGGCASAWLGGGCGGGGGGGSSTTTGSTSGTGGSSSGARPDAAWTLNMASNGGTCTLPNSTRQLGDIGNPSDSTIPAPVVDEAHVCQTSDGFSVCPMGTTGMTTASVTCSVVEEGSGFAVDATASAGVDALTIHIPSLTTAATKANPAVGIVSYASDATVSVFSSTKCDFYFVPGGSEGVGPGKVWVAFTCAAIMSSQATCSVVESYAGFENCAY